jgi:hypothetical protein
MTAERARQITEEYAHLSLPLGFENAAVRVLRDRGFQPEDYLVYTPEARCQEVEGRV